MMPIFLPPFWWLLLLLFPRVIIVYTKKEGQKSDTEGKESESELAKSD